MARLTSLILITIASLAIASPLNPLSDETSQDKKPKPKPSKTTTTATSPTIIAKNIDGCNVQGTAEAGLTSKIFDTYDDADNFLNCQRICGGVTACISYSFDVNTSVCTAYRQFMDNLVLVDTSSGIFFSDKYPSDGTNFCYQSA